MPFGKMIITLDDVSFHVHLPIRDDFWDPRRGYDEEGAIDYAIKFLGVGLEEVIKHIRVCMGAYYKMEWMCDLFMHHRVANQLNFFSRAYMIMLLGATIFSNKRHLLL